MPHRITEDEMKNFEKWNNVKLDINLFGENKVFNQGEVWYMSLGKNIGYEQDGKGEYFSRPVLVLKKFNSYVFYGIPLTSIRKENKFHFGFDGKTGKMSYAILSQMRLFDSKRLEEKIGGISFADMKKLKIQIKKLIF